MKLLSLVLVFVLTLAGCSDSGREIVSYADQDPLVTNLLEEINSVESAIERGLVFRRATKTEKKELKTILYRLRSFSLKLNKDPKDKETSKAFFILLKKFESFDLVERDTYLFDSVIKAMKVTLDKFARIQGISFDNLEWALFSYRFTDGLFPFQQVKVLAESASWEFVMGKFAKIGGRGKPSENWLVSQKINMKGVTKLSLKVNHTVKNPIWDNFKVLISDNYNGADPRESTWTEIDIKPKKAVAADKWTDLETAFLDISEFVGKEIVLAFKYTSNTETKTVWEILKAEFRGSGDNVKAKNINISFKTPDVPPTPTDNNIRIFKHFFKAGLGEFVGVKEVETAAEFRINESEVDGNSLRISSFVKDGDNKVGVSRLNSPIINLSNKQNVAVEYKRSFKYYNDLAKKQNFLSLQVSDATTEVRSWITLQSQGFPSGDDFEHVKSGLIEIPSQLINKKVQFSFRYESTESVNPLWDISLFEVVEVKDL